MNSCILTVEHIGRKIHDQNEHSAHVNFVKLLTLIQYYSEYRKDGFIKVGEKNP